MKKPPKSWVAMLLFVFSGLFACGFAFAAYQFAQLPGDSHEGTMTKIGILEAMRYSGIAAMTTCAFGYVVQMTADIRWKLFQGQANA